MKRTLTAVAVLLVLGLSARAQQPSPPTGSISGQVVLDGKPVAGIGVLVSTRQDFGDAKTVARTSTDKEGNFTFSDLAAGNYTLLPDAPAYVINGQKRSWNPGMSVTL
ncbi:MAG TPA: carboxypeptidase regulatory-like domain-containing protein, partial [Blastocatellia bacterium]|nr:carboxypeptidase regulatory-like domain-containing protein [Blastocatellia bacterium]